MAADVRRRELTRWWSKAPALSTEDYTLLGQVGGAYAAHDRSGRPALVVPVLEAPPTMVGRTSAGFELAGRAALRFDWEGRAWEAAAAVLCCTEPELVESFTVMTSDVLGRLDASPSWADVVGLVDEWLTLLRPRGRPSAEREMGLWAELWFIAGAADLGRVLDAWRGPDGAPMDFFVDGLAVDIKASTHRRRHHVSQTQVDAPTGTHPAWLLSMWLELDPATRVTVAALAADVVSRAPEPAEALRRLARAGYVPADRAAFTQSYAVLDPPEWYPTDTVPRVRLADPGVSQLRYQVTLDPNAQADEAQTRSLWQHFLRRDDGSSDR